MNDRKARPESLVGELLTDGLRRNDLKNLVSDVISIDEYNSKIDDSAIVLAFYVKDRQAAQDLNRFVQKSYVDLLDTDISPAPDARGYYMVFVELPLNTKLPEAIKDVTKDVGALCGIEDWRMRLRSVKGTQAFNIKTVARVMNDEMNATIHEFFHTSDLTNVIMEGEALSLTGSTGTIKLPFLSFGKRDRLFTQFNLGEQAVACGRERLQAKNLQLLLGNAWDVEVIGEQVVLQNYNSLQIMLLQML